MERAPDASRFSSAGFQILNSGFDFRSSLLRSVCPLGLSARFVRSRNFSETRLTSESLLLLCRPEKRGGGQSGKEPGEISGFLLAAIEMIATVVGPAGPGAFENVAQFLQKSR
jgi:hypothetical protein